jgi:hypothetical protein
VPTAVNFERYGGRGITICDEWLTHPAAFYAWALKSGCADNLTIDRIDNNKGYSPENCRWVTVKEQANNRRSNISIAYKGRTQTLKQWCEELGPQYVPTYKRIVLRHWDVERAFNTTGNPYLRNITYKGKTQPLKTWCRELGLPYLTVYHRLGKLHWSIEKAFETKVRRLANGRKN